MSPNSRLRNRKIKASNKVGSNIELKHAVKFYWEHIELKQAVKFYWKHNELKQAVKCYWNISNLSKQLSKQVYRKQ